MRRRGFAVWMAVIVAASALLTTTSGDEPKEKLRGWQKLFEEHAADYKIVVADQEKPAVSLISEPVLQWSQPVRGGEDGAVYLWTQAGRPVAIGALFIWPMGNGKQGVAHELHSLSQEPLKAAWRDRTWTPPENSIVWNALDAAPAPAATPEQRLRQMRDLAKQFKAESQDKNAKRWELRLLPRPIYRYALESKDPLESRAVVDGALFGFVEGTDLEVVLLIQARPLMSGDLRWELALARMSDFHLRVTHGDRPVWEVEPSGPDKPKAAYHCSTVETRTSAEEK